MMAMTEGGFAALVGRYRRSDKDVTIKSAIALMQDSLAGLMPDQQEKDSEICGTTVLAWCSSAILLKDSEGKLYRIATDDNGDLTIDQDSDSALNLLSVEGALDKVFNPDAVAELQRLQAEFVAEARDKGRNAELAELERLKAKYEGKDND